MSELWQGGSAWILSGAWVELALRGALSVGLVGLFLVAAKAATIALAGLRRKSRTGRPLIYIVEKLVGYGVVFAGVLVGLSTLGVDLTSLTVFAGALGVGVGLGLQGVVREFVSGLVAIFDAQVQVGDFIELKNGLRGEIVEIGPRATRVRTNDGVHVIIPNSRLIENQVINWTLKGGTRRIHVPFSVAYEADRGKVRDVVMEVARAVPFTLPDEGSRKTQVCLSGCSAHYMVGARTSRPRRRLGGRTQARDDRMDLLRDRLVGWSAEPPFVRRAPPSSTAFPAQTDGVHSQSSEAPR